MFFYRKVSKEWLLFFKEGMARPDTYTNFPFRLISIITR